MTARDVLIDTYVHIPPLQAVSGLTAPDAERHVPNAPHSIAEIVAHMAFWQEWFCRRCAGEPEPMPVSASLGWPPTAPGSWTAVHDRFVSGLERAAGLDAKSAARITPALEFPPLAHYTVGDAVVHMAQHNSHHLAQVVLLRQMLGVWPPASGSWTW